MIEILSIFILGMLAGIFLPRLGTHRHEVYQEEQEVPALKAPNLLAASGVIARQKEKKESNKQAIIGAFAWAEGGRMANEDVEKMLGVSSVTASRYLEELEKEGKIRKIISENSTVYYEKTG